MTGLSLLLPTCVRDIALAPLEEVPADDCDILEDTPPEREQRNEVEVDAQSVAQESEARGEQEVRVEAREEDPGVEVTLELGAIGPEQRVERREDADSRIARPLDRDIEAQREAQQDARDESEEWEKQSLDPLRARSCRHAYRRHALLRAYDDVIGAAHVNVV